MASDTELANGQDLKAQLRRADRQRRFAAIMLLAPLFLFSVVFFAMPILGLLTKAIHSTEFHDAFPETVEQLSINDEFDEALFRALFSDIRQSDKDRTIGKAARRLNQDAGGMISMLSRASRASRKVESDLPSYKDWFLDIDSRWADATYQQAIKRAASPYTDIFLLKSVDLMRDQSGGITAVPSDSALFITVFGRTIWISVIVTLVCVVLGYPVAWTLAHAPAGWRNIMLACVLFPFWTSLLVRTAGWIIVLQKFGPINQSLQFLGMIDEPLQLVFNRFGVLVALTHIMLPFVILPLYGVMIGVRSDYMRAAKSLGARPIRAFLTVYVPLTLPGISAGAILVFILSIGYYITPALVGGPRDQMVSYFIAFYTNNTINWGLASALALNLLVVTLVLYALFQKVTGSKPGGMSV